MLSVCTDVSVLKLRAVVMSFAATWTQVEIIILNEVKPDTERQITYNST